MQTPGPKLRWRKDREEWEIVWYDGATRRRRGTGTADHRAATDVLAGFVADQRQPSAGPCDPAQRVIAEVLAAYAQDHIPNLADPQRTIDAITPLLPFWVAMKVGDITPTLCVAYAVRRGRAANTVRRELTILRAAINHDYAHGRITRSVPVSLPQRGESKDRWLTRGEAAALLRSARSDVRSRWHLPLFILMRLYTGAR